MSRSRQQTISAVVSSLLPAWLTLPSCAVAVFSAASPTFSSPTASSPSSAGVKSEQGRRRLLRPPDRVSFIAASKEGFNRAAGSQARRTVADDGDDEMKDSKPEPSRPEIILDDDDAALLSKKREAKMETEEEREEEDDDDDEQQQDSKTSRYPPITIPFGKQTTLPLSSSSSSSSLRFPLGSPAAVLTAAPADQFFFFQLPSHLPLQPSLLPTAAAAASSSSSSSSSLPTKPPVLESSSSSFSRHSSSLQKRLLTFHPSFENSLRWVRPGAIGRLSLTRKGRVSLDIGGVRLRVDRGMDCSYHQRVVSVHAEGAEDTAAATAASAPAAAPPSTARREWLELGEVRQRLVCTLDVNDLRRKKERSERLEDDRDGNSDMQDVKVKEEQQQQ